MIDNPKKHSIIARKVQTFNHITNRWVTFIYLDKREKFDPKNYLEQNFKWRIIKEVVEQPWKAGA